MFIASPKVVKKKGSTTQKYSLAKISMSIKAIHEIRKDIQYLPDDLASFMVLKNFFKYTA
ncbi:hypothetical protein BH20BAC1_BH20BAC1_27050 [soil metagenome]